MKWTIITLSKWLIVTFSCRHSTIYHLTVCIPIESNQCLIELILVPSTQPGALRYQGGHGLVSTVLDNVTVCDTGSWCWRSGFLVGQHYKVALRAHTYTLVPILICYQMLQTNKSIKLRQSIFTECANISVSVLNLLH